MKKAIQIFAAVIFLCALLKLNHAQASIFGEENIALLKLVSGQVLELERLAASLEVAEDQRKILVDLNEGVTKTLNQIDSIEEIVVRSQGLDPSNTRRVSDLTYFLEETKSLKHRTEDLLAIRLTAAENAVSQSALQSETAYTMGQEMIGVGSQLTEESKKATPGRATQIQAAASSASMLSQGIQLQTLAHIAQLQAMSLELQRAQMSKDLTNQSIQSQYFVESINQNQPRRRVQ